MNTPWFTQIRIRTSRRRWSRSRFNRPPVQTVLLTKQSGSTLVQYLLLLTPITLFIFTFIFAEKRSNATSLELPSTLHHFLIVVTPRLKLSPRAHILPSPPQILAPPLPQIGGSPIVVPPRRREFSVLIVVAAEPLGEAVDPAGPQIIDPIAEVSLVVDEALGGANRKLVAGVSVDPGGKGASFKRCASEKLGGREEKGAWEKRKSARLHGNKGMKKTNLG